MEFKRNSWGLLDGDGAGWIFTHRFRDFPIGWFTGMHPSKNYTAARFLGKSCDYVGLSTGPSFYLSC